MSRKRYEIELCIAIRSPFLFQGLAATALGIDANALRNEKGVPIIPADHVRGLVRAALCEIAKATDGSVVSQNDIDAWLGAPSRLSTNGEMERPNRGLLLFADLELDQQEDQTTERRELLHRVRIDRETGAAEEGMLQTIELVCPLGKIAKFCGTIVAYLEDNEAGNCIGALEKAIKLLPAMGALKSVGLGEVVGEECTVRPKGDPSEIRPSAEALSGAVSRSSDTLEFDITFDRPILVATRHLADNVFAGESFVPGAAIKGAIARRIELAGGSPDAPGDALGEALGRLVISHAWPLDAEGRECDRALPLSLAVDPEAAEEEVSLRDALSYQGTDPLLGFAHAPAWQPDWKDEHAKAARNLLDRPASQMASLPRGHTAIGPDGIASDEQLFVMVARSNLLSDGNGEWQPRRWRLRVHRNGVDDDDAFRQIVSILCNGLDGIGRTGARLEVVRGPQEGKAPAVCPVTLQGKQGGEAFIVLLETPAVMTDPWDTRPMAEQYQDYFRWASGVNDLELLDHFAQRELAGGHVARRRRAWGSNIYHPFELTVAGSVFLLHGNLKAWLERAVLSGLPSVKRVNGRYAELDWRKCPFVPGNGYGAISADGRMFEAFASDGQGEQGRAA